MNILFTAPLSSELLPHRPCSSCRTPLPHPLHPLYFFQFHLRFVNLLSTIILVLTALSPILQVANIPACFHSVQYIPYLPCLGKQRVSLPDFFLEILSSEPHLYQAAKQSLFTQCGETSKCIIIYLRGMSNNITLSKDEQCSVVIGQGRMVLTEKG